MFRGVDLSPGSSVVMSGDRAQELEGRSRGGGMGIMLRIRFEAKSARVKIVVRR